ncbi:MAG TPA: DUF2007 domain-containing protein [Gemmatimonadales bacterium]|nr:DUF2007 domain-containing protein [Gemmatimonadales bacterium]
MSLRVIVGFAGVGILGWLLFRWLVTTNTDDPGATEVAEYQSSAAAGRAREVLAQAGITAFLDDHHSSVVSIGEVGITRVLVPEHRVAAARKALSDASKYVESGEG